MYIFEPVRPNLLCECLLYLKKNNVFYGDVSIAASQINSFSVPPIDENEIYEEIDFKIEKDISNTENSTKENFVNVLGEFISDEFPIEIETDYTSSQKINPRSFEEGEND